jgi:hypothetical protein
MLESLNSNTHANCHCDTLSVLYLYNMMIGRDKWLSLFGSLRCSDGAWLDHIGRPPPVFSNRQADKIIRVALMTIMGRLRP